MDGRIANGAFDAKKRWKQRRFQQVLHYITFQLQCWLICWEKNDIFSRVLSLVPSSALWLAHCTRLPIHFIGRDSLALSLGDVVYFISLLHTLEQFIIEFTLSLQWISQNNELRGKINILNETWKWNATMHNDWLALLSHFYFLSLYLQFRSRRLTLNYFILV